MTEIDRGDCSKRGLISAKSLPSFFSPVSLRIKVLDLPGVYPWWQKHVTNTVCIVFISTLFKTVTKGRKKLTC